MFVFNVTVTRDDGSVSSHVVVASSSMAVWNVAMDSVGVVRVDVERVHETADAWDVV